MTRRIFFDGEMEDARVQKFFQDLESAEKDNMDVIVMLSTPGGFECYPGPLAKACDDYPFNLEIHVVWLAQSGGFFWCCQTKRKVVFLPVSSGAIHVASRQVQSRDLLDEKSDATFLLGELDKRNGKWLADVKPFLTKEEYADLEKGRIVSFNAARGQTVSDKMAGRS